VALGKSRALKMPFKWLSYGYEILHGLLIQINSHKQKKWEPPSPVNLPEQGRGKWFKGHETWGKLIISDQTTV
jgi:hypothetical protein